MNKKDIKKGLMPYIFLLVFFIGCLLIFNIFNNVVNELTYDEFLQDLNGGKITELTITPKVRTETYKLTGKLENYKDNESFVLYIPRSEEFISQITTVAPFKISFLAVAKPIPLAPPVTIATFPSNIIHLPILT